jgi:D-amino-acid dehydrogenase
MSEGTDPHVVVVGGGVIGVSCAYYLARRGARVTLLERDEIGSGATFGNAGCIAPGHGPLNKPGRVKQALTSLLDDTSPLYIAPCAGCVCSAGSAAPSTRSMRCGRWPP